MIFRASPTLGFIVGLGIFSLVSCDFENNTFIQENITLCIDQDRIFAEKHLVSPSEVNSRFDYVGVFPEIYANRENGELVYGTVYEGELRHCHIVDDYNIQSVVLKDGDLFGSIGFSPDDKTFFVKTADFKRDLENLSAVPFGPTTFSSIALQGNSPKELWLPFTQYTSKGTVKLSILNLDTGDVQKLYETRPGFRVQIDPIAEACRVSGDREISLKSNSLSKGCIRIVYDVKPCSETCDEKYFFTSTKAGASTPQNPIAIYLHGGPFIMLNGGVGNIGNLLNQMGFDVVAINYPYTLGASNEPGGYNWDELNDWVGNMISEVVRSEAFSSRDFILIADSFGGALALNYMPPEDVKLEAVVSINAAMTTHFFIEELEHLAPHYVSLYCTLFENCSTEQLFVKETKVRALCSRAEQTFIFKSEIDIKSDSGFFKEDWFSQENCGSVIFSQLDDQRHELDSIQLVLVIQEVLTNLN